MAVSPSERPDASQDCLFDNDARSLLDEACAPVASAGSSKTEPAAAPAAQPAE